MGKLSKRSVLMIIEAICIFVILIVCIVDMTKGIENILVTGMKGGGFKIVKTLFSDVVTTRKGTISSFYANLAKNGIIGCCLGLLILAGLVFAEIKEKKVPLSFVLALLVAISNSDFWFWQQLFDSSLKSLKDFHVITLIASLTGFISAVIICRMEKRARKDAIVKKAKEESQEKEQPKQ